MEKITFDSGIKTYRINGAGVLRFNPGDPNVYARFLEAADKLQNIEDGLIAEAKTLPEADGAGVVRLLGKADAEIKALLGWVFGQDNDFDKILGGVNLLAITDNGQRVVTNLMEALQPILTAGAECCAAEKVSAAVQKAKLRRGACL